ncbi:Putative conserved lipoprotein LpqU [Mycobacteroides abscessus subsp. massiliense]|nr:Putative conserved lipoprotein LpqU [Mycobacteroides abscessus subsp. massiliense]
MRLDGSNGNLRLPDTDKGVLDGDANQDRAMGPMQFIPETWRIYGVRAAGEGDPDLSTTEGWIKALWAYNMSDVYAEQVRDWATAYAKGGSL